MRATLPELPDQKAARFAQQYGLSGYDAGVLTASRELADYYEAVVQARATGAEARRQLGDGRAGRGAQKENLELASGKMPAERLAGLLTRIGDQTISGKIAKEVFEAMWSQGAGADAVIE